MYFPGTLAHTAKKDRGKWEQATPRFCLVIVSPINTPLSSLVRSLIPPTAILCCGEEEGRKRAKERGRCQLVSLVSFGENHWRACRFPDPGSSETLHGSSTNPSRRKEHVSTLRLSMSQTYLVPGLPSGSQPCLPTPRFMHTPWPASNQVTGTGPGYWPA